MGNWFEANFNSFDGTTLFYRYYKPEITTTNTLLFLHRGHEHSGRVVSIANQIAQDEYWCFAFDLRGHGHSAGERGWAPSFETWVQDLNSFAGHLRTEYGIKTTDAVLVANSIGSAMAVSWILNYSPNLRGCILGAPAFSIRLYIPGALFFLRIVSKISNKRFVTSYVRSNLLTRDSEQARAYDEDSMITKLIGVNVLVTLFDTIKNCFNRLPDFETPVLVLTAEKDFIVNNKYHRIFYEGISSEKKQWHTLSDFRHAIFHEKELHKPIGYCRQFINEVFEVRVDQLPAVIPEAREHTRQEYSALVDTGSVPKQLYYQCYRWMLEKFGKHSTGVATGLQYGFDSGVSLDYVYQNNVNGDHLLGRLIDRSYLSSVGWKGIRTRKINLKNSLAAVLQQITAAGSEPRVLDIASGPGRYLFELQQESDFKLMLHLNDVDSNSLDRAKVIASESGAEHISYSDVDVFNNELNQQLSFVPNVIIISGLLELYDNNGIALNLLNRLYEMLDVGGYLLYTGQPWHPQMELIGRLLNNRLGKRWVMRRRVQRELDQLIESAGFEKLSTVTDDTGIFTVSCAQKLTNEQVATKRSE